MIIKSLTLALCTLSLLSCGQEWEVVRGPISEYGKPDESAIEDVNPASARPNQRTRRRPVTPRPLKDNPFAVPEVTKDLPNEQDLKPAGPTAGTPVPVDPTEVKDPTVTAKPPAPAE